MNRLSLLLILGLVAGCDTWTENDGLYAQGCRPGPNSSVLTTIDDPQDSVIDPTSGQCIGRANGGGAGGSGGGTGGSGGSIFPPLDGETNLGTCGSMADPANDNCDYGCMALGNTFGFVAVLGVSPEESLAGGSQTLTEFDGFFVVSEAFLQGASDALGGVQFTEARIPEGATLPLTALEGATGPDLVLTLQEVTIDLTEDPDNNGVAGPFFLPFVMDGETYTYGESGSEACFNLTDGIAFVFEITQPFPLAPQFMCQPCDQELINEDEPEIVPEPTAGQVCFTIP